MLPAPRLDARASEHILFDFDGTIADSLGLVVDLYNGLAPRYGFRPMEKARLAAFREMSLRERFRTLGVPFYMLPLLGRAMKRAHGEHIHSMAAFPGMKEALLALRESGYTLSVVSSNAEENILRFLAHHGISCFSHVHPASSLFGKHRTIRAHLKQARVAPEDVLYVGDELRDLEACRKVGVRMLAVTWGADTAEKLAAQGPAALAQTPEALGPTVLQLFRNSASDE